MHIGRRVKRLRDQWGWTQVDLAHRAGIKQSLLSRLESGSRDNPTADTIVRLARTLRCTTDYLLGMFDEEQKGTPEAPAS
jgi:transcriptional regulator with XRE-family HTH domain